MRTSAFCMLVVGLVALSGCGKSDDPPGQFNGVEITGTVTLDGKPVEAGIVTALQADDLTKSSTGQLGPGGKFKIANCPVGQVAFTVNTKAAMGMEMQNFKNTKGKDPIKVTDVPTRYLDAKSAKLLFDVSAGSDVKLELTR